MNENILLPSLTIHQQEEKNPLHMLASMENMRASWDLESRGWLSLDSYKQSLFKYEKKKNWLGTSK